MRIQNIAICFSIMSLLLTLALNGCQSSDKTETAAKDAQLRPDELVVDLIATDTTDALELLLKTHEVAYQSSMMGAFVTGIGAVENSSAGYWVYKVNDTTPKIACDKMVLLPGDRLKWLFQSSDEPEPNEAD